MGHHINILIKKEEHLIKKEEGTVRRWSGSSDFHVKNAKEKIKKYESIIKKYESIQPKLEEYDGRAKNGKERLAEFLVELLLFKKGPKGKKKKGRDPESLKGIVTMRHIRYLIKKEEGTVRRWSGSSDFHVKNAKEKIKKYESIQRKLGYM